MTKKLQNGHHRGFTLIELLLTLAILGIVITAVINFFIFNLNTYVSGDARASVQFDVRMASDFVTTELRNVETISTDDDTLDSILDLATLSAKHSSVDSVSFEITSEGTSYFVVYTIGGNSPEGNSPYEMTTKVLLNNITSTTLSAGNTLYYSK